DSDLQPPLPIRDWRLGTYRRISDIAADPGCRDCVVANGAKPSQQRRCDVWDAASDPGRRMAVVREDAGGPNPAASVRASGMGGTAGDGHQFAADWPVGRRPYSVRAVRTSSQD